MENLVDAATITNIEGDGSNVNEKVFVLICRYWRKEEKKECQKGQVYFILTSVEKDRIFNNILENLRLEEEISNCRK